MHPLHSAVRALRSSRGWSQTDLGERVGITRQSLAAIESGRSVPSTDIALRLARAFDLPVEALFRLDDEPEVRIVEASGLGAPLPGRVRIARVSGRVLGFSVPPTDTHGGQPADGEGEILPDGRIRLRPLPSPPPEPDLVVAGCDPAFGLVQDRLRREHGIETLWLSTGSRAALEALARGAIHVAGVHLLEPETGAYNRPWVERIVPFPATRISFAVWQQSLLLQRDNPLGIGGLEDLPRPEVRFLNREPGSGSRMLLERALADRDVSGDDIPGFTDTAADGHGTVAAAVASGAANAAVGIRSVGRAHGLHTVLLGEEPYELVIPDHFLELPAVTALLRELRGPGLKRQVEALGGYDAAAMGQPA